MRIGIITFYKAENYGAFLQSYGLQTAIKQRFPNCDVEIVNYQGESLTNCYKIRLGGWYDTSLQFRTNCIRGFEHFYQLPIRIDRKRRFRKCLRKLNISAEIKKNELSYDIVILGSDQIWNPRITDGLDAVYFGIHDNVKYKHKISYAASIGGMFYSREQEKTVAEYLSQFTEVSIRELSHREYVSRLAAKSVEVVIDPTLLIGIDVWDAFATKKKTKDKYVLFYSLEMNGGLLSLAKQTAQHENLKLIVISEPPLVRKQDGGLVQYFYDIGPKEFVGLIKNAECIFTDSFHGTCFSIIFRKAFYTILHSNTGSRVYDLLTGLGMESHIVSLDDLPDLSCISQIAYASYISKEYEAAYIKLNQLRISSYAFLEKIIEGI